MTNNYFHSSSIPVQLDVTGHPYYVAVAVDDTNYLNATNWTLYTSANITVPLGTTQGWHDVRVALRDHADAPSAAVWQYKRLKLDTMPPQLVITGPTNGTVNVPVIQLTGYCPEALAGISYDLSNAAGTVTNLDVLILDQSYDATTWEFTTTTFEAFDVPLTNGVNTFTLHATDLAGNVTATNFTFTLDYSGKTNPPLLQCLWPTNGMQIVGSTVTLRGQVDDPTATVTATVTGANGDTSTVSGYVEPNGRFWVENLPLNGGTNIVSITLNNAVNLSTYLTINLVQSALTLTINPLADASQLWQPTVSVSGTVTAGYGVWVNGVAATHYTNNGDGTSTWCADNVPVPPGGVATWDLTAYPPGEMPAGGSSGNGVNPQTPHAGNTPVEGDKPTELYVQSSTVNNNSAYSDDITVGVVTSTGAADYYVEDQNWTISGVHALTNGTGGPGFARVASRWDQWTTWTPTYSDYSDQQTWITWTNFSVPFVTPGSWIAYDSFYSNCGDVGDTGVRTGDSYGPPAIDDEHCVLPEVQRDDPPVVYPGDGYLEGDTLTFTRKQINARVAQTKWQLNTGGKAGRQSLWCLSGWATEKHLSSNQTSNILASRISIKGRKLGADGNLWVVLPDGMDNLDVTPVVKDVDYYWFGVNTQKYRLFVQANDSLLAQNPVMPTNTFCVGQKMTFSPLWIPSKPPYVNSTARWHFPGNYVNEKPYSWCSGYYDENDDLLFGESVFCWYANALQAGIASIGMNLQFANGQYVSIAALGQFSVHRPSLVHWDGPIASPNAQLYNVGSSWRLGVGDNFGRVDINYDVFINSQFSGKAGITQVYDDESIPVNSGSNTLDCSTWYDIPKPNLTTVGVPFSGTNQVALEDAPYEGCNSSVSNLTALVIQFRDYVRFRPDAGNVSENIFVTLGQVNWNVNAHATYSSGVWTKDPNSIVIGPVLDSQSDEFPFWSSTGPCAP